MRRNEKNDLILVPGTILRNRYEILKLLRTGGMGYVYLAQDRTLFDRSCVVKEVREPILSEETLKKLQEEALRMAKLSHSGVAMILDHFVEKDHYFLVEEYVHGKTLREVFKEKQGQLSEEDVIRWAISICDVIAYIHKEGIIHRDISPDNIMLTEDGNIKFIDFGTLRELRSIAEGQTAGMGKHGYTPPEQWDGKPVPQSDLFALGATLYYLLTGFLPLSKEYIVGKSPQKEDFSPRFPPIRKRNTGISAQLETILEKVLQLDPEKRYPSVGEMRVALCRLQHETRREPGRSDSLSEVKKALKPRPIPVLSESAVKSKAISDTLQHPATLLALAICAISLIYLVLFSPAFGGALFAIIVAAVSGIAAVISYASLHEREYQKNTRELIRMQDEYRKQNEEAELSQLRETLEAGFSSISSAQGTSALDELLCEYEQLKSTLGEQRSTDSISASMIAALNDETYRRGLSVLTDALDLMNVIHTPGREKLEMEALEIENEIEAIKVNPGQSERLKLKQEVRTSFQERLAGLSKLQLWVEQLFYQAQRCEDSLHAARVELATIRAGNTKSSVDSVIQALEEKIKQVKEVQDELTRMGY
jgi:serine/threonine protein kinase